MAFDINNQYTGKMFGQDRIGQTTPDLESSEHVRPWLPVPYPAPYLPALRQDQGHPKLASVVLSSQHLVGQDKSGALVPAGLICGKTPAGSNQWCILQFSSGTADEFTVDPRTSGPVTPGDHCVLAAPADAAPGNVTLPNGTVVAVAQADIDWAFECNLFPAVTSGSTATTTTESLTLAAAIVPSSLTAGSTATFTLYKSTDELTGSFTFQVGTTGTQVTVNVSTASTLAQVATAVTAAITAATGVTGVTASASGSTLVITGPEDASGSTPGTNTIVLVGQLIEAVAASTTIPYSYGVARPIGVATRNVLQYIGGVKLVGPAPTDGGIHYRLEGLVPTGFQVMNYMHEMGTAIQTQYVLRLPWIGATPNALQQQATSDGLAGYVQGYGRTFAHYTGAPQVGNGVTFSSQQSDYGNYSDFNAAVNSPVDLVGRIIGVMDMIYKIGFSNRIKTLWDPARMVGPMNDPNPAAIMMGGSATGGLPYDLNLTTDGIYKQALLQNKPVHPQYGTYVLVRVNL